MAGLIGWGIGLIVLGVLVSLFLPGEPGGGLVYVGWILVGLGVVLAILHFVMGGTFGRRPVT